MLRYLTGITQSCTLHSAFLACVLLSLSFLSVCTFIFSTYFYRPSNLISHTHKAPASVTIYIALLCSAPYSTALTPPLPPSPGRTLPPPYRQLCWYTIFYVHRIRKTLSKIAYNQFDFIKTSAPKAVPRPSLRCTPSLSLSLSFFLHLANHKNIAGSCRLVYMLPPYESNDDDDDD